jgi:hypothetical protein
MAINADASKTGTMVTNADQATQGAQDISNALQSNLTNQENLYSFFTDLAGQNSVRMLGKNSGLQQIPGDNWQTAFMMDGAESNISLSGTPSNNFNLPPGYSFDQNFVTQTKRNVQQNANLYFLKGYRPITIGTTTFWQVPFECDGKPYLVSQTNFDPAAQKNVTEINQWSQPVPNAYSAMGKGGGATTTNESAISRVLTNPNEPFQMSIPHGFIHVKVQEMDVHWWFFPMGIPTEYTAVQSTYGFIPDTQTCVPMLGGGILCTSVSPEEILIGTEVAGADIQRDIYSYPDTDTSLVDQTLVNRCNEMITAPGVVLSTNDVYNCLHNGANIPALIAGVTDFYIYSKDGKTISCLPLPLAVQEAPWLATVSSQDPDGEIAKIASDADFDPGPPSIPPIPIVVPAPFCSPTPACFEWSTLHKEIYWTPGSGYNKNLGELSIKRWTDVYSLGICNPL